ncbi:MAG: vitamin K epoxide reductase family protein [Verrucomicrobiota bacterium]|nr:vitamin K epoxide reductase family protein [Verrucomicrobiota bacterium]
MKPSKQEGDRVRGIMFTVIAVLALVGVAESTYLAASHFAGAEIVCGGTANCSEVLGSAYASFHGIPLAALGGLAYFTAFGCATLAAFGYRRAPTFLALIVGVMFLTTLWLLYLQAYVLHAFCTFCLASAAIIFILAGLVIGLPSRR